VVIPSVLLLFTECLDTLVREGDLPEVVPFAGAVTVRSAGLHKVVLFCDVMYLVQVCVGELGSQCVVGVLDLDTVESLPRQVLYHHVEVALVSAGVGEHCHAAGVMDHIDGFTVVEVETVARFEVRYLFTHLSGFDEIAQDVGTSHGAVGEQFDARYHCDTVEFLF